MSASQPHSAPATASSDVKAAPKAEAMPLSTWILKMTDTAASEGKGAYAKDHFQLKLRSVSTEESVTVLHEHYGTIVAKELGKQYKNLTAQDYLDMTKKINAETSTHSNLYYAKMLITFLKELYKDPSYDSFTKPEVVASFPAVTGTFPFITPIHDFRAKRDADEKRHQELADAKLSPEDKAAKICVELIRKYFTKIDADIPKGATAFFKKGYRSFKHGSAVEEIKRITDAAPNDAKGLQAITNHLMKLWNWKRDDKKFSDQQLVEFLNDDKGESYYRTIGFVLKYVETWNAQLKIPAIKTPPGISKLASGENNKVFAREIADNFKPVLGEITNILNPKAKPAPAATL